MRVVQGDRLNKRDLEQLANDGPWDAVVDTSRPQWDKCLEHLREGDTLVVVRLDHMGRSVRNLIAVANDLQARGVNLLVLDQAIDTSTPAGRFFFHTMALAEMEADMIRERTHDGLEAARARGRTGGRKAKLTAQAAEVRRLDAAKEKTVKEIGELFGITRESVYRYVKQAA